MQRMVMISSSSITVTDVDCVPEVTTEEPITPWTDEELTTAFSTGQLTADHCLYLEAAGVSWEIDVERQ